ncbi:MAG TPA: PaaI family thioesterase [Vicinamibacterales bacterium]|nr:PaaI family thioesterase [Vicinamibacterales bacterium]
MSDQTRSRTITWLDPAATPWQATTESGLAVLRRVVAGELPNSPMAQLMGLTLLAVDDGSAVFSAVPAECHYNPAGIAHGGFAATLLDSAMGCAVYTTMPPGVTYTTLELKVNFMRPMTEKTGEVRATGRVLHRGRRTIVADGRIEDAAGRLVAHASTTCLVYEP